MIRKMLTAYVTPALHAVYTRKRIAEMWKAEVCAHYERLGYEPVPSSARAWWTGDNINGSVGVR